jgi:hypothetical protein
VAAITVRTPVPTHPTRIMFIVRITPFILRTTTGTAREASPPVTPNRTRQRFWSMAAIATVTE